MSKRKSDGDFWDAKVRKDGKSIPAWFSQHGDEVLSCLLTLAIGQHEGSSDHAMQTLAEADGVTRFYAMKECAERIYGKVKHAQPMVEIKEFEGYTIDEIKEKTARAAYCAAHEAILQGNDKVILQTLKAVDERYRGTDDLNQKNDELVDGFQLAIIDAN